ncbi:MAG: hypothetical protein JEZ00_21785 [Anaerolineaceae bacterium]|nr:hypothetical protein [Anaerolineaceae bacterium]
MKTKHHGILSLSFVGMAIAIAGYTAARLNILLLIGYLVFSLLAFITVITAYCSKCPCKTHCAHVLPGLLAGRIDRQPGPYTKLELTLLLLAIAILLILPNVWLWHFLHWMVIYWLVAIIAIIEIRQYVCKPCGNVFCPLNK